MIISDLNHLEVLDSGLEEVTGGWGYYIPVPSHLPVSGGISFNVNVNVSKNFVKLKGNQATGAFNASAKGSNTLTDGYVNVSTTSHSSNSSGGAIAQSA